MPKNGLMAKLSNGEVCEREIHENFILSQRAGKTHCLCSESATYIGSGEEAKGKNVEDERKQMRTELHIQSID